MEKVKTEKDLGVIIDNKLRFREQVVKARNAANRAVGFIARNVNYKSKEVIRNLYISYVRPHLEYCAQAWAPHYEMDLDLLEKVQRRATKLVNGFGDLEYEERLKRLDLFSLRRRYIRGDLIEVFKMFKGLNGLNPENLFELDNRIGRGNCKKIKKQRFNLDIRKFFFSQRIINLWNKLDNDLIESDSLDTLKQKLDIDIYMAKEGYI